MAEGRIASLSPFLLFLLLDLYVRGMAPNAEEYAMLRGSTKSATVWRD